MKKRIEDLNCVLLIDDDAATNLFHKLIIESAGIDTTIQRVSSGSEGLEYLTSTGRFALQPQFPQPGLILLDIKMPGMNGWEFLREYEKLPDGQKAKVVLAMLTTSVHPDDLAMAKQFSSINGFYRKPFSKEMLLEILSTYFPIKETGRQIGNE